MAIYRQSSTSNKLKQLNTINRFKQENSNTFDKFISLKLALRMFYKIVHHCYYFFSDVLLQDSLIGFAIVVR